MRDRTNQTFFPIREFWADYLYSQVSVSPPELKSDAVSSYLDLLFGGLTKHELNDIKALPISGTCTGCRNNTDLRRDSVCQTHIGAVRGTLEAILKVPLQITYTPEPGSKCCLKIEIEKSIDGRPLAAWARTMHHVILTENNSSYLVHDNLSFLDTEITEDTFRVLKEASDFITPKKLALKLDMDLLYTTQILDECYQLGWVESTFKVDPEAEQTI